MENSLKLHIFPAGRNVCKVVVSVFISDFFSAPRPMGAENFIDKNGWMADRFVMLGL